MISATLSTIRNSAQNIVFAAEEGLGRIGHLLGHVDDLVASARHDGHEVAEQSAELVQLLGSRYEGVKEVLRASPKAIRISKTLVTIALHYKIELARGEVLKSEANLALHEERLLAMHEHNARVIRDLCIECRGTFLKLGQFLSMRPDLLPDAYIREFASLRDQVPALPFSEILPQLEAELGGPIDQWYCKFEQEACAAASLAQVHRATGHEGQEFALKVQIPDAAAQVASDIAILRALAHLLGENLPFDCAPVLKQLADSVGEELDYDLEAEQCRRLGRLLAPYAGISVPEVESAHSSDKLLVLRWMPGLSLDRALASRELKDRREILNRLVEVYARQILQFGFFHADPHAGNILVQEDNTIVLLDFGCCGQLSANEKDAYRALLISLFARDSDKLYRHFQTLGFASEDVGQDAVLTLVDMLQDHSAITAWAENPQAAIQEMLDATAAIPGLRTPRHFVLLGRVLATLGGILIDNADAKLSLLPIVIKVLSEGDGKAGVPVSPTSSAGPKLED